MASQLTGSTKTIIHLGQALYGVAPSNGLLKAFDAQATANPNAFANDIGNNFRSMSNIDFVNMVFKNIGLTPTYAGFAPGGYTVLQTAAVDYLNQAGLDNRGLVTLQFTNFVSSSEGNAVYGAAALALNNQAAANFAYASNTSNLQPASVQATSSGMVFTLTDSTATNPDAGGVKTMHLTGDQDVRIDFTNTLNQITGLDLNGNGVITNNGIENALNVKPASGYVAVDAYARLTDGVMNEYNLAKVFLGDIAYDGTGYKGDGVTTNGNIVLGGLGADVILGGIGNDFIAGGGVAQSRAAAEMTAWLAAGNTAASFVAKAGDTLSGGRNADFFFTELSLLSATDGNKLKIDGGTTADDTSAANSQSKQDSDWLLLQASDDDEPVEVVLDENGATGLTGLGVGTAGSVTTRAGQNATLKDVENVDASGNLYGFLKGVTTTLGGAPVNANNNGIGSSAQLIIQGSTAANKLIGGYDNDVIQGGSGNDLLMGGNLKSYTEAVGGATVAQDLINANLVGLVGGNNGRDVLEGGAGDDDISFEADGGTISGGTVTAGLDDAAGNDTLWLTDMSLGLVAAADAATVITDGVLRMDLKTQLGQDSSAGYGGADSGTTADQSKYIPTLARTIVTGMDNVIATGLGNIDFKAAGSNTAADLKFQNQQNFQAYNGNLDLRGTDTVNTLYAAGGKDVIEGRTGGTLTTNDKGQFTAATDAREKLSGGAQSDKFIFSLNQAAGDGVDVIHRQVDANGDNIWDGTFGKDFGEKGAVINANSTLTINLPGGGTGIVGGISFLLDGVTYTVNNLASGTYAGFKDNLNTQLDLQAKLAPLNAVLNADNTITITDPAGGTFAKNPAGGWVVVGPLPADGTSSWSQTVGAPSSSQDKDVLIYAAYEDRLDGELVDDNAVTGSSISLGVDSYAEDLVVDFKTTSNGLVSTWLAEDQHYALAFNNLTTEDRVELNVNNVVYALTVGVDLDGNEIAGEELLTQGGTAADQAAIQTAFLTRFANFITSFTDDDTAAGKITAASTATTITLTPGTYDAEQTVFLRTPTLVITNASGGEPATVAVLNDSQHEVQLLDFDGRVGELNATNVLFIGNQGEANSRSILATGAGATGTANTMTGSEAMVVDGGANTLASTLFGVSTAIQDNTATNSKLRFDFTVHGDDQLIGGVANDTINAGTGDDRVLGSLGADVIDGGKSYYAVNVLNEAQARVYTLNEWEANNPTLVTALTAITAAGSTITSITKIVDAENDGTGLAAGADKVEVYKDTLQFNQSDFAAGTKFTVTLDNFSGASASTIQFQNAGAGKVSVDNAGDGVVDATTTFTNFENIRTVSGTGNAVAGVGGGQGNDTLNVASLSTAAGGVSYDLTDGANAGKVNYSVDAHVNGAPVVPAVVYPLTADFEKLVIRVDGVESVIAGSGDDLLLIDETEAAKDNTFTASTGTDRIEYQDVFAGDVLGSAVPTMTIKVNSASDTDTVTMTAGRVGSVVATDTLLGVEYLTLAGNAAEGSRENDVLDVSNVASAVVDYTNGQIRTDYKVGSNVQLVVEGLNEVEQVLGSAAINDTVIVNTLALMAGNTRADALLSEVVLGLATYLDFDDFKLATSTTPVARVAFGADTAMMSKTLNQNEFKIDLGTAGSDTVDYSKTTDTIAAVVNFGTDVTKQYVLVGVDDNDLIDVGNRVDQLTSVERVVASQAKSVLDLTSATQDLKISFSNNFNDTLATSWDANFEAGKYGREVHEIKVANALSGTSVINTNYIDYSFVDTSVPDTTALPANARWTGIEGSDKNETVELTGYEAGAANVINLRGGNNKVSYEGKKLAVEIKIVDYDAANPTTTGQIQVKADHTGIADDHNATTVSDPTITAQDIITSYSQQNLIAKGVLTIKATRDGQDSFTFDPLTTADKTYVFGGAVEATPSINVQVGTGAQANSLELIGFEAIQDSGFSQDVYDFVNFASISSELKLSDDLVNADHDTAKVGNAAAGLDGDANAATILLGGLGVVANNSLLGSAFTFDVLDVTGVTGTTITTVTGTAGVTEELVVGNLNGIVTATAFESVVVTDAFVTQNGTSITLNTTANTLVAGAKTLTLSDNAATGNYLSFGGTVMEQAAAPNHLRASGSLTATGALTVTTVGNEAVNITGGSGNDSISTLGGDDTLRGGAGNDTLNGGFTAATGPIYTVTLPGATTDSGTFAGAGTLTIAGLTISAAVAPVGATQIAQNADADQVGAAFAAQSLASWQAALQTVAGGSLTALQAATLTGVTYNATANTLAFAFSTSADATLINAALIGNPAAGGNAVMAATETNTQPWAAQIESRDTYVFESTAALNGADTISSFNATDAATDDLLDFRAFLGAAVVGTDTVATSIATGKDLLAAELVGVVFNKGTLAASDIALATGANVANKIGLVDNGKAVVLVTADADGVADATNNAYSVYFVQDTNSSLTAQTFTVTLVGTINSTSELSAANLLSAANGGDVFVG